MKVTKTQLNTLNLAATLIFAFFYTSCAPQAHNSQATNDSEISSQDSSHIVGGINASTTFQKENGIVALAITSSGMSGGLSICTGTLIAKRIILTAAHCLQAAPMTKISKIEVYFMNNIQRSLNIGNAQNSILADKMAPHADFLKDVTEETVNLKGWNDIALIRLKSDAPATFKMAQLPQASQALAVVESDKVILSGFGVATPIVNKSETNTQTGKVEIVGVPEQSETAGILRIIEGIPVLKELNADEILLDQTNSTGACHGDSGGPAFVKQSNGSLIQVGITSRGTNSIGNCNEKAIYTRVSSHLAWIEKTKNSLISVK